MQDKQIQIENNIVTKIGKVLGEHTVKLITKLTECKAEIFCSSIMRETDKNKKLLMQNIIKHHLPIESRRDIQDEEEIRVEPNKAEEDIIAEEEMEVLSSLIVLKEVRRIRGVEERKLK